jgi:hypothetical protein
MSAPAEEPRPSLVELQTTAGQAVGRIHLWGKRGVTDLSAREIEAMATLLFCAGLPPLAPNTDLDEAVPLRLEIVGEVAS